MPDHETEAESLRRQIEAEYGEPERSRRLARYDAMLADGQAPRFAAMCACNHAPGTKGTDRAFQQGGENQFDRMTPVNAQAILAMARRAGISTVGKRYEGGLGGYTDPAAWVSDTSDVLRVARARNLDVTGVVTHRAVETPPPAPVPLAEPLVQEEIRSRCAADPALAEKVRKNPRARQELREAVLDRHAYKPPKV